MQVLHEISTPQLVRDFQKSTTRERHVENNFRTELWTPSGCVRWEPHKARPSSRIAYLSCRSGDSEPRPYGDRSVQDKWLTAGVKNLARMKQPGSKKPSSPWHLVCQMILPIIIALEDRNSNNLLVCQVGGRCPKSFGPHPKKCWEEIVPLT